MWTAQSAVHSFLLFLFFFFFSTITTLLDTIVDFSFVSCLLHPYTPLQVPCCFPPSAMAACVLVHYPAASIVFSAACFGILPYIMTFPTIELLIRIFFFFVSSLFISYNEIHTTHSG